MTVTALTDDGPPGVTLSATPLASHPPGIRRRFAVAVLGAVGALLLGGVGEATAAPAVPDPPSGCTWMPTGGTCHFGFTDGNWKQVVVPAGVRSVVVRLSGGDGGDGGTFPGGAGGPGGAGHTFYFTRDVAADAPDIDRLYSVIVGARGEDGAVTTAGTTDSATPGAGFGGPGGGAFLGDGVEGRRVARGGAGGGGTLVADAWRFLAYAAGGGGGGGAGNADRAAGGAAQSGLAAQRTNGDPGASPRAPRAGGVDGAGAGGGGGGGSRGGLGGAGGTAVGLPGLGGSDGTDLRPDGSRSVVGAAGDGNGEVVLTYSMYPPGSAPAPTPMR